MSEWRSIRGVMEPSEFMETETIRAFIVPARRERYVAMLGNAKRRGKLCGKLDHCHDFDVRYATSVEGSVAAYRLLVSHGAPAMCHVISNFRGIDGKSFALEEALGEADRSGCGTLLCCLPGELAFYIGESGEQRLLLRRLSTSARQR